MRKKLIALICVCAMGTSFVFSGCTNRKSSKEVSEVTKDLDEDEKDTENISKFEINPNYTEDELENDYDENEAEKIELNKDSVSTESANVSVKGSVVTINKSGTYLLSGKLSDGCIIVDSKDDGNVRLVFDGVEINSGTTAPLYIKNAKKTIVTLAEGTENTLTDGEKYTFEDESDKEPNGTIFSKDDLVINGLGSLKINANYNHGIQSKDILKIISGDIDITSVGDSIVGKDGVVVKDATINIDSEEDGVKATKAEENKGYIYLDNPKITINAVKDGIQACTCLYIKDGNYNIITAEKSDGKTGDDKNKSNDTQNKSDTDSVTDNTTDDETTYSRKGIKAGVDITIDGGEYAIDSIDDGIHSNNSITLNKGNVVISTEDDGIHADEELVINAGDVNITDSYEGLEAKFITINDGNISIIANDDGINASSGSGSSENDKFMEFNQNKNGGGMGEAPERPSGAEGEMGEVPERPSGAEGEMGEAPERPSGAEGGMGEAPERPSGAEGEMGEAPERPSGAEGEMGKAPELPSDANGDNSGKMFGGQGGFTENDGSELVINGGVIKVNANGDGIDSNGIITINGGEIYVDGPTQGGDGALDYGESCEINGGILVAAGSVGMAVSPTSGSGQYSVNAALSKVYEGGTKVTVKDSSENEVLSYTPSKNFQSFVFSTDKLKSGETYTIYTGENEEETFTISEITTSVGNVTTDMGGGKPNEMGNKMNGGRTEKN